MKSDSVFPKVLVCAACFLLGAAAIVAYVLLAFGGAENYGRALKLARISAVVDKRYVEKVDLNAASEAAYGAFVASAADRWSYYMDADTYERYKNHVDNKFQGIGVTVLADGNENGFLITSVMDGGPAREAGIRAGDVIAAVNGESTADMDFAILRSAIQAQYGSTIRLTLLRDGQTIELDVRCGLVENEIVKHHIFENNIAYIAIANFDRGAADKTLAALEAVKGAGAKGLIFDVRGNGGGFLDELEAILDPLLPEGKMFISVSASGEEHIDYSDAASADVPIAVLIDENSYSAAEFFAAALQEYGAVTVGHPTTGKSRSQLTFELGDGSAVHISTDKYLTPNGVDLSEVGGIVPDILADSDTTVLLYGNTAEYDGDGQLLAALAYMQEQILHQ